NSSDVKSETQRRSLDPAPLPSHGRRRAYIISVGITGYSNPDWNLRFAARDAQLFAAELEERLRDTHQFDEVVKVLLTSDEAGQPLAGSDGPATKANFKQALRRLAGDDQGTAGFSKVAPDD